MSEFHDELTLLDVAYLFLLALAFGVVAPWPMVHANRDSDAAELARASAARDLMAMLGILWPGVLALYAAHQIVLTQRAADPPHRLRMTVVGMASDRAPSAFS